MPKSAHTLSRWLTVWALTGFLVRAVVPSGFMVAPPVDGWPVVPCPGQEHGVLHQELAKSERAEHPKHSSDGDTDCYLGYFFALAAELGTDITMVSSSLLDAGPILPEPQPTLVSTERNDVRPRAPPIAA